MTALKFIKMHGLGNDFAVFDARAKSFALDTDQAKAIADRHTGIGCDQLIVLEAPGNADADLFMRIRNADGGEVDACGNATRCIGAMVMDEKGSDNAVIETNIGTLETWRAANGAVAVDMGEAKLDWRDIPLAEEADTLSLDIAEGPLVNPVAVSVGNPHAAFFVNDASSVPLDQVGPIIEHHSMFPARTNVEAIEVTGDASLRVRVWERGVGITRACGTGACASLVAAHRRGLMGRRAEVELDGGVLEIEWRDDDHVLMTGATAISFTGTWML